MVSRALTALNVYPEIVADLEVGRPSVKVDTHVLIEFHPEAEIPLLVDEGVDALVVAVDALVVAVVYEKLEHSAFVLVDL